MKIKICILSILSFLLVSIFPILEVSANVEINPDEDPKFSKYVNLVKDATYYEDIVVQSLENSNVYEKCDYISEKYQDKQIINNNSKSKIGFKINGEFYVNSVDLNESGNYSIKVYHYTYKNKIIKAMGNPIETFNITLNLGYEPELSLTNIYVEHYINSDDMVAKIKGSFKNIPSNQINITNSDKLKKTFLEVYSSKSDTSFLLKYNYKNISYEKELIIKSVVNADKNKFVTNEADLLKNIANEKYYFATENLKQMLGQTTSEYLDQYINIYSKLNYHESQSLALSYSGGKETSLQPTLYQIPSVKYTINDNLKNIEGIPTIGKLEFNLNCFSYPFQNNYQNEIGTYTPEIVFNDEIKLPLNSSKEVVEEILRNSIKDYFVNVFISETEKGKDYSFQNFELSVSRFDTSFIGKSDVEIEITVETKISKIVLTSTQKVNVTIAKQYEPKILTKYNKIVLKDSNDTSYQISQIYVLDSDGSRINNVSYKIEQSGQNGYIIITATDDNGFETTKKVPFVYEVKTSKMSNFLARYGEFLRNIFK